MAVRLITNLDIIKTMIVSPITGKNLHRKRDDGEIMTVEIVVTKRMTVRSN